MYLKDVLPGHTYKMETARGVFAIFTVAVKRYTEGEPGCMVETMRDKAAGIPATMFTRPGLTTVIEVL